MHIVNGYNIFISMSNKKVGIGIVAGVVIILSVLYYMGYWYVGFKSPGQSVVAQYGICGDEVIDNYNKVAMIFNPEEAKKSFNTITEEIEEKSNYTEDSSCTFMLAASYIQLNNIEKANTAIESYSKVANSGKYPNVKINNLQSPTVLKQLAEARSNMLDSNTQPSDSPGGG